MIKNLLANAGATGDTGSIPGSGRSPGGRNGNPLQYSCLENSHGQRSLVGYHPWGHKESDTTEAIENACTHVISEKFMVLEYHGRNVASLFPVEIRFI